MNALAPTLILAADYGASPLWLVTARGRISVPLERLPLDATLRRRLVAWAEVFDALARTDYAWPSESAEAEWHAEAEELIVVVRAQLGSAYDVRLDPG